jgi:hypothetical protein
MPSRPSRPFDLPATWSHPHSHVHASGSPLGPGDFGETVTVREAEGEVRQRPSISLGIATSDGSRVPELLRRIIAAAVAVTLIALVACDLWIARFRAWWDRHSLTASVVSNLLVLAVAALIVDEVTARRGRRKRSVSVAVQGLIVYGQARRAFDAVMGTGEHDALEELRSFASMLLTASSSLFDDPVARRFLADVERFSGSMFRTISASRGGVLSADGRALLTSEMSQLQETVQPLLARIPSADRSVFEGPSQP